MNSVTSNQPDVIEQVAKGHRRDVVILGGYGWRRQSARHWHPDSAIEHCQ